MNIRSMFIKSIDRDIKGVIKADQIDEQNIYEELDEYVVTKQLARHFSTFFDAYQKSLHAPTDKVGVWISGFFGSGKSHFLKILSYLLENREVNNRKAVDFFKDKIEDPLVMANMEQAGNASCDVILFNIDSKGAHNSKNSKEGIVKVFAKVFYDMQGFYGDMPWVADMESALESEGVYEDFKHAIKELTGEEWETRRRRILFDRDIVIEALHKSRNMSQEAALEWFRARDDNVVLSIENFAKTVNEYLDKQGPDHRLVFLVDEMGQYIGDNTQMMLNLQTIVEDLGTHCRGRVWVMVTSQEDLDSIVKGIGRSMENDFSKIQGRFDTRLNLTSANVDEVIKRRILEKTQTAIDTLSLYYMEKSAVLRNLISFAAGTPEMRNFSDKMEFAEVYPFVPYQFNLLQKVFTGIRQYASSGRHLASGERSLLDAFQDAAQAYGDETIGVLVPFHRFYDSISTFLDSSVSQVIEQAETNTRLKPEDIDVLKLLFMIKYVEEMPPKLDNITTLMVSHVDQDKLALKESILGSLRRLSDETLIQKNGDDYIFLTNEEQEVNREIKKMEIDHSEICKEIGDIIFEQIYSDRRYRYSNQYDFSFNQMVDDRPRGSQDGEITLQIITPAFSGGSEEQDFKALSSLKPNHILFVLPDNRAFLEEIEMALKIEAYKIRRASVKTSASIQEIITSKLAEREERKRRATSLLTLALGEANVYVRGDRLEQGGRNPKDKIDQALKRLVEIIYFKLNYVQQFVRSTVELQAILTGAEGQLYVEEEDPNKLAIEEIKAFVERRHLLNDQVNMKKVIDQFERSPYGWNQFDIAAQVAKLARNQELRLQYGGANLPITDRNIPDYLTKRTEVEKLVIRKRIGPDPELISKVRNLGHTVFNHSSLSADEDGLSSQMLAILNAQKQLAERLLDRYQERGGLKYPGKQDVSQAKVLFDSLLHFSEPVQLFEGLVQNEQGLKASVDNLQLVEGFFKNQKIIFDEALSLLDLFENNKQHISDLGLLGIIEEMQSIVMSSEPYSKIHRLPVLRDQFKAKFSKLLEDTCYPIQGLIEKDYGLVQDELAKYTFDERFVRKVQAPFEQLLEQIKQVNDFNKAYSMESISRNYRLQAWKQIEEEQARLNELETDEGDLDPTPPVILKKVKLGVHDLFDQRVILKNTDDVDQFLEKLRKTLEDRLVDDTEIEIVW